MKIRYLEMNKIKNFKLSLVLIIITMCIVLAIVIYPFIWLFLSSLKYEMDIVKFPPETFPERFTFSQYFRVWQKLPLLTMTRNTFIFSTMTTFTNSLLCAMGGYAFARIPFKGKNIVFVFVLISMMVPFQVFMIPLYIIEYGMGILDSFMGLLLPRLTWPFGIYMLRSFFSSIPKSIEEAARIDGANEYVIFWRIMFPLCLPAVLTIGIMTLVNNWNDLAYPLILTNSVQMRTLSVGLAMFVGQRVIEYGPTLAAAMVSLIPLMIVYVFLQKFFVRGVIMSGLKG
jgi:multiple sugar transport system permease protein